VSGLALTLVAPCSPLKKKGVSKISSPDDKAVEIEQQQHRQRERQQTSTHEHTTTGSLSIVACTSRCNNNNTAT
jgi:hypothetical protein